jgi:hypothetical protein
VLHAKSFEAYAADDNRHARLDQAAIFDRKAVDQPPSRFRRIDRARRAPRQPKGMIAMTVSKDDCGGSNRLQRLQPIGPAIDHDAGAAPLDEQRAVPTMAVRSYFDLAARAEKSQLDLSTPCDRAPS